MSLTPRQQCATYVWVRDCYRRTGRGKTGFEMHYIKRRCKRSACVGDWCRQHSKEQYSSTTGATP